MSGRKITGLKGYLERKILVGEKKGSCIYLPQNNFDESWEVLKEGLRNKRFTKEYLGSFQRSLFYKETKEMLRNSTGILETC